MGAQFLGFVFDLLHYAWMYYIIHMYLSICLFVYLPIRLSVYLSICLSIFLFMDLSISIPFSILNGSYGSGQQR